MRALIIGLGYLGERAAKTLSEAGFTVDALVRSPKSSPYIRRTFQKDEIKEIDAELVLLSVAPKRGESYRTVYLETAKWLLPFLSSSCHLFYSSSTSVYGDQEGRVVNEETALFPKTEEANILVETEKLLMCHKKTTILRLGEIVGPGRSPLDRLRKGVELPGTGENFVNLTPVSLAPHAMFKLFQQEKIGLFNVVLPWHPTRRAFYEMLAKENALPAPKWNPELASIHGGNRQVSSEKLAHLMQLPSGSCSFD